MRGRLVVVGVEQVRAAARKGGLALALVADDAAAHSVAKVVPLLEARGVPLFGGVSGQVLGHAVGKEQVAAVGVTDPALAKGIRELGLPVREGPRRTD
ncbi:MAG: ribosomal L7Ae/L30e/S12e/Gadd45 family protein [Gemmatimonadaceae bacterium]|nr:ribosomal L7Ae/L30e/S12e/Gadd45 family protein [Gemmatimonadaceae bacterium]